MTERRDADDPTPLPAARPGFDTPAFDGMEARTVPLRTEEEHRARKLQTDAEHAAAEARAALLTEYRETTAEQDAADPYNRAEWVGGILDDTVSRPAPMDREATTHEVTVAGASFTYRRDPDAPQRWVAEDLNTSVVDEVRDATADRTAAWDAALSPE